MIEKKKKLNYVFNKLHFRKKKNKRNRVAYLINEKKRKKEIELHSIQVYNMGILQITIDLSNLY